MRRKISQQARESNFDKEILILEKNFTNLFFYAIHTLISLEVISLQTKANNGFQTAKA